MGREHKVQDQPDLTIPEDTIVRATLQEIEYKEISYTDKKTGKPASFEKSEWWFEVQDERFVTPEGKKRRVKGEAEDTLSNHPANKFRQWASALLGRALSVGDDLSDEDLVGLTVDITVKHDPDRKNPEKVWERVDQVIPLDAGFDLAGEPPF